MFCNNCGRQIDDNAGFCVHCGHRVERVSQPPSQPTQRIEPGQTTVRPTPSPTQTQASAPQPATPRQGEAGSRLPAPVLVVLLISLALFGAGVAFFVMSRGANTSGDAAANTTSQSGSEATSSGAFDASTESQADAKTKPETKTESEAEAEAEPEPEPEVVTYDVPDVVGLPEDDAVSRVNDAGLYVMDITYVETDTLEEGVVFSQDPSAQTTLSSPEGVSLFVAVAPEEQPHTYVVVTEAMTWAEANAYCAEHGGHLVTINSQEEYDEVVSLVRGYSQQVFWIGAYRTGDGFAWITGEPFSYTAWASGEPNNDQGIEDYAAIFSLTDGSIGWYDVPNDLSPYYRSTKLAFVMEVEQ